MSSTNIFVTLIMSLVGWFTPNNNQGVNSMENQVVDSLEVTEELPLANDYINKPLTNTHIQSKSLRLITGHTSSVLPKGSFEFGIQHRFGQISSGAENLYGLDNFNSVRIGFDYGLSKRLTAGVGRSSLNKTINTYGKWKFLGKHNSKWNATYVADLAIDTRPKQNWGLDPFYWTHRFAYTHQLIVSFAPTKTTLIGVNPSIIHLNLVDRREYSNDIPILGFYARQQVSKKLAFTLEGSTLVNGIVKTQPKDKPTLGFGFEYYTPQHVFQVNLTNSRSMNERYFLLESPTSNSVRNFCLGFNLIRRW